MKNVVREHHSNGICPPSMYGLTYVPISWGEAEERVSGSRRGERGLRRVPKADFLVRERANMENVVRECTVAESCSESVHYRRTD